MPTCCLFLLLPNFGANFDKGREKTSWVMKGEEEKSSVERESNSKTYCHDGWVDLTSHPLATSCRKRKKKRRETDREKPIIFEPLLKGNLLPYPEWVILSYYRKTVVDSWKENEKWNNFYKSIGKQTMRGTWGLLRSNRNSISEGPSSEPTASPSP